MRLDKYLNEKGLISSRTKAKNAIKSRFISVNDEIITEPDYNISDKDKIKILDERLSEMPKGYFKLERLLDKTRAIYDTDKVLDLGSSAGGYLLKASEIAKKVYGIEISEEFKKDLRKIEKQKPDIQVIIGNAFKINIDEACPEDVDVILNDMTLEPLLSFAGLERFLPKLKNSGKILMTLKLQDLKIDEVKKLAKNVCEMNNLELLDFIKSTDRNEIFLYAQKLPTPFGKRLSL